MKILICDDNPMNRKLIGAMLKGSPYMVTEVSDGGGCLELLLTATQNFDLVLLDISMKGIGGVEVCQRLREFWEGKGVHVPLIAYTAHAMLDERNRFITLGFDDVLTKPVLRQDLFAMLEKYLGETKPY